MQIHKRINIPHGSEYFLSKNEFCHKVYITEALDNYLELCYKIELEPTIRFSWEKLIFCIEVFIRATIVIRHTYCSNTLGL